MDLSSLLKNEIAKKQNELEKPCLATPERPETSAGLHTETAADVAVKTAEEPEKVEEAFKETPTMVLQRLQTRPERVKDALEQDERADVTIAIAAIGDSDPATAADLAIKCNLYIHQLLQEWQDTDYKPELVIETKKALYPLLVRLRKHTLAAELITSVATILYHIQHAQFAQATQSYLKLSIGNVAWPIGVTSVGIHARSAHERIQGRDKIANVMLDETTRLWITSVKRLVSFAAVSAAEGRRRKSQLQQE
ncbi:LAFA_0E07272g1_1 [Lachancea sp. 'fantastica']|nr:LAFA_0E07272g1_1 [Lachancea sp. 'fantastica']